MFPFETANLEIIVVADNAKSRKVTASNSAPRLPALCPLTKINRFSRTSDKGKCRWTSGLSGPLSDNVVAKPAFPECSTSLPTFPRRLSDPSLPPRRPSRASFDGDRFHRTVSDPSMPPRQPSRATFDGDRLSRTASDASLPPRQPSRAGFNGDRFPRTFSDASLPPRQPSRASFNYDIDLDLDLEGAIMF